MDRIEAEAKDKYDAFTQARIQHWFKGAPEPNEDEYGYRHGWIQHEGQSFCVAKWYPDNQPIMD